MEIDGAAEVAPAAVPEPIAPPEAPAPAAAPAVEAPAADVEPAEPPTSAAPEEPKGAAPKPAKSATPKAKKPAAPAALPAGEGRVARERKAAQPVYQVEAKQEEEFVIKEGKGTKLRDIPNVAFKLAKVTGKDELLESLHSVLYRRKGVANQRKKAILDFSGWAFDEEATERELEARSASLGKWKVDLIHRLLDALDLPRGAGSKDSKVERAMEFLAAPRQQSDVDLASKEAAKKDKERAKRERAAAKNETDRAKKAKAKAKAKKDKEGAPQAKRKSTDAKAPPKKKAKVEVEGGEEEEGSASESEPEVASEAEDMEEEQMPKKKARAAKPSKAPAAKPTKSPAAKPSKAPTAKPSKAPATKPSKAPAAERAAAPAEEDDPALKVPAAQLDADVRSMLAKMSKEELAAMTAKTVMTALQAQYGFAVRCRKREIKEIAQAYADSLPSGDDA